MDLKISCTLQSSGRTPYSPTISSPSVSSIHSCASGYLAAAPLAPRPLNAGHEGSNQANIFSPALNLPGLEFPKFDHDDKRSSIIAPTPLHETSALHELFLMFEDESIKTFIEITRYMFEDFRLSLDVPNGDKALTFGDFIRVAIWWFLQSRMKLEPLLQEGSSFPFAQEDDNNNILLQQAQADLAKALWILKEIQATIDETSSERIRDAKWYSPDDNTTGLVSLRLELMVRIHQTISGTRRQKFLFQQSKAPMVSAETNTSMWIPYPTSTIDVGYLLTGHHTSPSDACSRDMSISTIFPLGDTKDTFHFGSMHVDLFILTNSPASQHIQFPALLSTVRGINEPNLSVVIGTQDGLVNFSITPDRTNYPSWDDVTWMTDVSAVEVKLPTGFRLQLRFGAWDFQTLRRMYDYSNQTLTTFMPSWDESLIFETDVKSVQYCFNPMSEPHIFPKSPIAGCRFRLFEKTALQSFGTGPRHTHCGFRLAVITPPSFKRLSILSHEIFGRRAIQFDFLHGESENPSISLKLGHKEPGSTLILSFDEPQKQNILLAHLTGCFVYEQEAVLAQVQVNSVSVSTGLEPPLPALGLNNFEWKSLRVVNQHPAGSPIVNAENTQPGQSESLRIIVDSPKGRITDRLNIGIGELKIRRNVLASGHELHILRHPQEDLTFAFSQLAMPSEVSERLKKDLETIQVQPSIRTYNFPNLSELHLFQSAVTGFSVLFDGVPRSFSISRRRMMIPIHKEWSAPHSRLQLLRRGRMVQLVAFFEGFRHGRCMNFALKETDVFEKSKRGGRILLKIADAKFSVPSGGKNSAGYEKGFACLDLLDYPGEHDNIYIGFDSDADFNKFSQALPAPVRVK